MRLTEKSPQSKRIAYLAFKLLVILILFYFFMRFKPFIILLVFEITDLIKNIAKQSLPYIPIDFVFLFGMLAAYYYGFIYSVAIFVMGVINRIIMSAINFRHMSKGVRHIPLFFFCTLLKNQNLNFFSTAVLLLAANYVLKYGLNIAFAKWEFDKIHYHLVNISDALFFFYLMYKLYSYFPFLA